MSYTLSVVNHSPITIQNGSTDSTTSLTLVGKNYPNYGQLLQQDLINLLQSWAGSTQPSNPVTGQLWWNTSITSLQIYTGSTFKNVGGATVATSAPTSTAIQGDLWFKSDDQQLFVYSGTQWLLVGPSYTSSQQKTTATAINITDTSNGSHTVLSFYVGNSLTGILNKDPQFTPNNTFTAANPGFSTIVPGYNVNSTIFAGNITVGGTIVQNSQPYITSVGTLTSLTVSSPIVGSVLYNAGYVTNAAQGNITSVGTLTGLTVSGTATFSGTNNLGSNSNVKITGGTNNQYLQTDGSGNLKWATLTVAQQVGTSTVNYIPVYNSTTTVAGSSGLTYDGTNFVVTGHIKTTGTGTYNIGAPSNQFGTVYATATSALYADLAEKYLPDADYEIGTVVMVGGGAEVTKHDGSDMRALGVISANPAYKMNDGLEGGTYVALKGRVPVKISGTVCKGQPLCGYFGGKAVGEENMSIYTFAIALTDHIDPITETVEAVIL